MDLIYIAGNYSCSLFLLLGWPIKCASREHAMSGLTLLSGIVGLGLLLIYLIAAPASSGGFLHDTPRLDTARGLFPRSAATGEHLLALTAHAMEGRSNFSSRIETVLIVSAE